MCLLFFSFRGLHDAPFLLAANREESCYRPQSLPGTYQPPGSLLTFLAGEDRGAKGNSNEIGTWLGINEYSLVVAVTNRDDTSGRQKTKSRGLLCTKLLSSCKAVEDAVSMAMLELTQGGYGGGNYLIASPDKCVVVHDKPFNIEIVDVEPGVHGLANLDIDDPNDERIQFVKASLDTDNFEDSAKELCSHRNVLIHDDDWGTIASAILTVKEGLGNFELWHNLGKPTPNSYVLY